MKWMNVQLLSGNWKLNGQSRGEYCLLFLVAVFRCQVDILMTITMHTNLWFFCDVLKMCMQRDMHVHSQNIDFSRVVFKSSHPGACFYQVLGIRQELGPKSRTQHEGTRVHSEVKVQYMADQSITSRNGAQRDGRGIKKLEAKDQVHVKETSRYTGNTKLCWIWQPHRRKYWHNNTTMKQKWLIR